MSFDEKSDYFSHHEIGCNEEQASIAKIVAEKSLQFIPTSNQ